MEHGKGKYNLNNNNTSLWVFGYGSLMWKPDFAYKKKKIGYIKGYVRRFWQGNTTHRGTPEKPGRVATLVEEKDGIVWGVAYNVIGHQHIQNALQYLNNREMKLGGYLTLTTNFHPRGHTKQHIEVLVYTATPQNPDYLGPADNNKIAEEIVQTRGTAGTNSEYVTKLAEFVLTHIHEDKDHHLFQLDRIIRNLDLLKTIVNSTESLSIECSRMSSQLYNFHGDTLVTSN